MLYIIRQVDEKEHLSVGNSSLKVVNKIIEDRAGTHGRSRFVLVGLPVTADIYGFTLAFNQFGQDLLLVVSESFCQRLEGGVHLGLVLCPGFGDVEVAAAVVNFVDLARWR